MNTVITGANGFIGSALATFLSKRHHKLTCISNHANNISSQKSIQKCYPIALPSDDVISLIKHVKPDLLIHTAGRSSVPISVKDPASDYASGPPVVFQLLDALRSHSPKTIFLFLSSAAVYGNSATLPIHEESAISPISPYGYHKYQSELLVREFAEIYGIRSASVRIFSAYGIGLKRQLLWDVCQKAWASNQISLLGTGNEARDFIHITDVCRALEFISGKPDLLGQPINLCSGISTPIQEVSQLIASLFPHRPSIIFSGVQQLGAPVRWQGEASWLHSHGFNCSISVADGVKEYVSWFLKSQQPKD